MSDQILVEYFKTSFGELIIGSFQNKLCLCDWRYRKMREAIDKRIQSGLNANYLFAESEITEITKSQLSEYFDKKRQIFDIPMLFVGTEFQKSVWVKLMELKYGESETYLGLSMKLNNTKAIRAVAAANGANAISIIVPCHRIIGSNGELIGYAGGLETKKKLLQLESPEKSNDQLKLF